MAGAMQLSWGDFTFGQTGFNLYKKDNAGSFSLLNETVLPNESGSWIDMDVNEGANYEYKIGLVMANGKEILSGSLRKQMRGTPNSFQLLANSPNPLNGSTEIRYALSSDAETSLKIYDVSGSLVKTLVNSTVDAGYHSAVWDATNKAGQKVANGVYFYRLTVGDFAQSRKMVVLR
ncbi:T9SS type A sorting domain-containing protein [candidate division TA06 bacterium]|nr:T9SS type A sorting domain-containing protein [candidate division TA06 bacterium]